MRSRRKTRRVQGPTGRGVVQGIGGGGSSKAERMSANRNAKGFSKPRGGGGEGRRRNQSPGLVKVNTAPNHSKEEE